MERGKKDTGYQFRRWIEWNSFHYLTKSSFKYWYWNQGWGVVWLISWCILKSYISSIYIFMCQAQRKTFFEMRFYNSTWETICPFVLCCRVLWKGGITSAAVLMLRAILCDGCNSVVLQKANFNWKKNLGTGWVTGPPPVFWPTLFSLSVCAPTLYPIHTCDHVFPVNSAASAHSSQHRWKFQTLYWVLNKSFIG